MPSFNKVILIGNFTADPELKQTPNGISVCRFTLAVNRRYVPRNSTSEQATQTADFISVVAWKEKAEFVSRYFKKGRPILVSGQIQSRSWTDQSGQKHYSTEVLAEDLTFVESKSDAPSTSSNVSYTPEVYATPAYNNAGEETSNATQGGFEEIQGDDDLPF